jgi:hypothetical protein
LAILAKDFIENLLVKETSERMTASEALEHPWIADIYHQVSQISSSKYIYLYFQSEKERDGEK